LLANPSLNIDPAQVYIAGLSSGGGETMVLGCLAPEIFAGIGINAGPTIGTGVTEIGSVATNLQQAADTCERLAGSQRSAFDSQLTSVIYGSLDFTVAQDYNTLNATVMASLYEVSDKSRFSISELAGHNPTGTGEIWSDNVGPRVSLIESDGLGHAWPAGSGRGGAIEFVAREGVNYPAYVTEFFFENNRRVEKPSAVADKDDG
jgi:poly(3-hydroxybutyrate) depolymerase